MEHPVVSLASHGLAATFTWNVKLTRLSYRGKEWEKRGTAGRHGYVPGHSRIRSIREWPGTDILIVRTNLEANGSSPD